MTTSDGTEEPMDRVRDPAHAMRLFGLRFRDRGTEAAYRRWHVGTAIPFARTGYIGSTPSWVLLLAAIIVLDPDAAGQASIYVGGWILMLVVLTSLTFPTALRRTVMPLAAAANCAAGFLIVWLLSDVVLDDASPPAQEGVMTAGMLVVMFFGFAIFRVPPGPAISAVTPYVAFASFKVYEAYDGGELRPVEAGALSAAQWIAFLGCLLVCIVTELVDRRSFVQDQVIEAQQRELRASRETIRRYVPRAVSDHIVRGDTVSIEQPTRRHVTVLIADLVGFTPLAETVEAEVLTRVTNDYMNAMSQVVDQHGGIVNEFAGDGLMALFGAPDHLPMAEQAVRAVRAAQVMQERMPALNREWHDLGLPEQVQMRIGISTGLLTVGSFGSEGRMTYTAIGLHTNIAARLEGQCEPGGILMSVAARVLVGDAVPCEPRGEMHIKGVRDPIQVFSPVPVTSALEVPL